MTLHLITANRLSDGAVVYLDDNDDWSNEIDRGRTVAEDQIDALLAIADRAVQSCLIVAPYAIAIKKEGTRLRPVRFREQIRAQGPTVRAGRDA